MRKLAFFMHVSLDGFVAGPKGELDWAKLGEELFDFVGTLTARTDTALYGRKTYEMMQAYWPNAGKKPGATKHDREHAEWYNHVDKIVLSRTMKAPNDGKTTVINDKLSENINRIKRQPGQNIMVFGSPSAVQVLLAEGLVDEFWICLNPVLLGDGKRLFKETASRTQLEFRDSKPFSNGVVVLHYGKN